MGNRTNLAEASAKGADSNKAGADAFAANVRPIIRQVEAAGSKGGRAIAAALNVIGVRTARGGDWHASTVRNLLARADASSCRVTAVAPVLPGTISAPKDSH